ncbi:hypothetical protein HN014_06535 [Aquimarina sp. TRL1]|uniref:hypothetical protein n=1 Tax=Aquimarina sp. (strain TRL1) TaxID=2736252 RepID=UPI00158BCBB0|nr:hypothetical protein [Aquimarina sp. TRL1]QKX04583.1 hypothetical protein HN014_06535 [Aquimarina sp. TRL1]
MKRYKTHLFIALLLLGVVFVILYKNWQSRSYKFVVHADANRIVKVDVCEVAKTLLIDDVQYSKKDTEEGNTIRISTTSNGLRIPANIFFYTVPKAPKTIFCTLKAVNIEEAVSFLSQKLQVNIQSESTSFFLKTNEKRTISMAYLHNTIVLAYSFQKEDITSIFSQILTEGHYLTPNAPLFKKLKEKEHHLQFASLAGGYFSLDATKGQIALNGTFPPHPDIEYSTTTEIPEFDRTTPIQLFLAAHLKKKEKDTQISWKNHLVSQDSLLTSLQHHLFLRMHGFTTQQDSIIRYEYNDNFEKTAKVSLQEKKVPSLQIDIPIKNNSNVLSYLKNQQLLTKDHRIADAPMYHFYAQQTEKDFVISTTKTFKKPIDKRIASTAFLKLYIHLPPLIHELPNPVQSYGASIEKIHLIGKKVSDNRLYIDGMITFNNKEINALTQLLKKNATKLLGDKNMVN